jgi:small GTP-binding protein
MNTEKSFFCENDHDHIVKCIMLGRKGVGKSSIVEKMCQINNPEKDYKEVEETIGIEFSAFTFTTLNETKIKFQIWDGSGNTIYKDSIMRYCEGIDVIVFTFDMNDVSSLNEVIDWYTILKERDTSGNAILILIGNKLDLLADPRVNKRILSRKSKKNAESKTNEDDVASWNNLEHHSITEKAKAVAETMGAHYIEISSKTGQNMKKLFTDLINASISKYNIKPKFAKQSKQHQSKNKREEIIDDDGVAHKGKCVGECIIS